MGKNRDLGDLGVGCDARRWMLLVSVIFKYSSYIYHRRCPIVQPRIKGATEKLYSGLYTDLNAINIIWSTLVHVLECTSIKLRL